MPLYVACPVHCTCTVIMLHVLRARTQIHRVMMSTPCWSLPRVLAHDTRVVWVFRSSSPVMAQSQIFVCPQHTRWNVSAAALLHVALALPGNIAVALAEMVLSQRNRDVTEQCQHHSTSLPGLLSFLTFHLGLSAVDRPAGLAVLFGCLCCLHIADSTRPPSGS